MFSLVFPVVVLRDESTLRQVSKHLPPMMIVANPEHTNLQAEPHLSWTVTETLRNVQTNSSVSWVPPLTFCSAFRSRPVPFMQMHRSSFHKTHSRPSHILVSRRYSDMPRLIVVSRYSLEPGLLCQLFGLTCSKGLFFSNQECTDRKLLEQKHV
jgi:hypothetical protein